ncbi:MAG TPA: DUF5667 domain-containing protein, partial [Candidatus Paceibacterota bacterium]|nr:DUF5667 domain-containing protein [Candidatus Paceibacterota bacterium]
FSLLALLLISGGGVTMAAERAVPGETLYAIKTQVNEKVGAAWVNTSEERARYSARLAERRVDEAIVLADEGKLDADTAAYLEEKVVLHIESSVSAVAALESEGEVAAALSVRTDLEEHLTERALALAEAEVPSPAAPEVDMFVMRAAVEVEEKSPRALFADSIHQKARDLAVARERAETAVLPGLVEAKDRGLDLSLLRGKEEPAGAAAPEGEANATLTAETHATSTTERMETEERDLPLLAPPAIETDATVPLWLRTNR